MPRLVLGVLALLILAGGAPGPCHFELALNGWTTIPPLADRGIDFGLVGMWQRWDACWYGKIATYGYEPGTNANAFFPLVPTLHGVVARVLGGSVAWAGYLVSLAASVVAFAALVRLVGTDFGTRIGRRTARYVAIFPSAFFLIAPFTEAAFLAATVVTVLAARERRWGVAVIAAFLGGLTRLQGVFLVLPIAWELLRTARAALRERRASGERWREAIAPRPGDVLRTGVAAGAVVAPVAGLGVHVVGSTLATGTSPFDAQDMWGGREFHPPWEVADAAIRWGLERQEPLQFVNLAFLAAFIVIALIGMRRLPLSYTLLALPQLAIVAIRIQPTPLTATTRFLLVVWPVFVVLALWGRNRWLDFAITLGFTVGLGWLAAEFLRGNFVA